MPARFADKAPFQPGRHDVMTVFENVCFNRKIVADDALDWIAAAVD